MATPILATKLYVPLPRPKVVIRSRLIEQLNEGLNHNLILISAQAGFGKTTLVSEWVAKCEQRVAWLSLDEGDNDPARFLSYFVAALQTIEPNIDASILATLQSPQPPPAEVILTALLNKITTLSGDFILVLDDYHVIDAQPIDQILTFLLEHLPPQMHLVIATREDPQLSLARYRARGQLTELRAADLRFTPVEAADFLNQVMGLNLPAEDIASLETRTEGWIAGLQLAALSMQGQQDSSGFIRSFTGSHHFVLDYLLEEVLHRQPESIQTFLLHTSLLDRMCGPLCEAVMLGPFGSGQETLEYLEHANLFVIPLDNERRWYRYHHLFADLLRQRLHQSFAASMGDAERRVNELHIRASQWYEDNSLEFEAFQHAAAANDIERAERLIGGRGVPLHLRGAVTTILDWLGSLPTTVLNERPSLWWRYGSLLLVNGQTTGVEEKLDAAEAGLAAAISGNETNDKTRNLVGRIASARAVLALTRYQVENMITQSHRALEHLEPDNLSLRANANWILGYAYLLQGDRVASRQALEEAVSLSQVSGDVFFTILATVGLGVIEEAENHLHPAAEIYKHVLRLAGDQPLQIINEAYLGLARVFYEWNDLDVAEQHAQRSLHLARQYDKVIDRFIICEVFLARLELARGEVAEAAAILTRANQAALQHNFVHRLPEVAAAQVLTLLHQGDLTAAVDLVKVYELPLSQARVHLAQGDLSAALAVLSAYRQQVEAKGWQDEQLKVMIIQAVAYHLQGEKEKAMRVLGEALTMAEPSGFIRIFVDEGLPMKELLIRMNAAREGRGVKEYIHKLLAAFAKQDDVHPFGSASQKSIGTLQDRPSSFSFPPLPEPLSQRELEVLQLIAQGLSNEEICKKLFLALDTVKGHNRKIFDKLQVQRRTEAVARARALGLL